jgi:hypothetical protein
MTLRGLLFLLIATCGGACTAFDTPDLYNRHRLSDITLPRNDPGSEMFYFDVTLTPEFPADDPAAEAMRMQWLAEWLEQRNMCTAGHEVVRMRRFAFEEDNPARRDLRYEIKCRTQMAQPGAGR